MSRYDMSRATRILVGDLDSLPDGSVVPRFLKTCACCAERFLGQRSIGDYCSNNCRVRAQNDAAKMAEGLCAVD